MLGILGAKKSAPLRWRTECLDVDRWRAAKQAGPGCEKAVRKLDTVGCCWSMAGTHCHPLLLAGTVVSASGAACGSVFCRLGPTDPGGRVLSALPAGLANWLPLPEFSIPINFTLMYWWCWFGLLLLCSTVSIMNIVYSHSCIELSFTHFSTSNLTLLSVEALKLTFDETRLDFL